MASILKSRFHLLSLALVALLLSSCTSLSGTQGASRGPLDLRAWNPSRDGPVELFGAETIAGGSSSLRVLLPSGAAGLAIRLPCLPAGTELRANGVLVALSHGWEGGGGVENPNVPSPAAMASGVAALPEAPEGTLDLELSFRGREALAFGVWKPCLLGDEDGLRGGKRRDDIITYALAGVLLVTALVPLLLFLAKRKDRASLWFAVFALLVTFRGFVTGDRLVLDFLPALSFEVLARLEYLSAILPLPFLALFLVSLFPDEARRWLVPAFSLPVALYCLVVLPFASLSLLSNTAWFYFPFAGVFILSLFGFVLVPAVARHRRHAPVFLAGCLVLLACFVNDSLHAVSAIRTRDFLGLGLLVFVLLEAAILAKRFVEVQKELEKALAEKDLLFREMHHRVKNSLQLVSSTLGLQSNRSIHPEAQEDYRMARRRIGAISLVHEKLYGREPQGRVDLGEYARDLVERLHGSFGDGPAVAAIRIEAEPIEATVDDCVDFGLVLNELVANACKHASKADRPINVRVRVERRGDRVALLVEDDGPGFPPGFDPETTGTLGYRVVSSIARKHGGEAFFGAGPGAQVELLFSIGLN